MTHLRVGALLGIVALFLLGGTPALADTTERISVSSSESQALAGDSRWPSIDIDGRYVAFESDAGNLVPGDTNATTDIFVRNRVYGTTERVSVDSAEAEANWGGLEPAISDDSRFVAFSSGATNLVPGDGNANQDIFVRDLIAGTTERVSVDISEVESNAASAWPAISEDGRFVAFQSLATNLVAGDNNGYSDIFVRDRILGTTERVNVDSSEAQALAGHSFKPEISADGRFVVFESWATNLVAGDSNGQLDVFLRDRLLGTTERVNVSSGEAQATGGFSGWPAVSADGRFVAFTSSAATLVGSDSNGQEDIFIRDRAAGITDRVNLDGGGGQATGGASGRPSMSGDGRFVVFESAATNLVVADTNGFVDTFVRDRSLGTTQRISVSGTGAQAIGGDSIYPGISADGRFIGFESGATNLVSDDSNFAADIFVHFADIDSDGVADADDNCPSDWNPGQDDLDGDSEGDACDDDDDDDGLPDGSDSCPRLTEDLDGYQDADGCPETDNDLDGVDDTSDTGQTVWDPAGTLAAPTIDCRNISEDYDGFKDSDGCPEPDNDNDAFPDGADSCPGSQAVAGGNGMLGSPQDLNHNGIRDGVEAVLTSDDSALTFEDYDGVLDGDGCHDSPGDDFDGDGLNDDAEVFTYLTLPYNPDTDSDTVVDGTDNCPNWPNTAQELPSWPVPTSDSDCDGFAVAREQFVGSDPTRHCSSTAATNDEAVDAWPSDFNDNRITNLSDVVLMGPSYNKSAGQPGYNARFDLNASGTVNLSDVVLIGPFYNKSCA